MKKRNFKFLNKNVVIPSNKIKIDQIYQYITPNIPKIQLLRGMQDHFDNDARILNWIIQTAKQTRYFPSNMTLF